MIISNYPASQDVTHDVFYFLNAGVSQDKHTPAEEHVKQFPIF